MARALLMYRMALDSSPDGTVLFDDPEGDTRRALSVVEVAQHIKEVMECPTSPTVDLDPVYPVSGHPPMQPDAGFIELVNSPPSSLLVHPSPTF